MKKITFAETNEIEDYEQIAREFLESVFNLSRDSCFISDESMLSDFATCCLPESAIDNKLLSLNELYTIGDNEIVKRVHGIYGIEVKPTDTLVSVFSSIWLIKHCIKQ